MLDLGWTELLVIGVVALIVVGPKDLPVLFRNIGRFVGRMKGMAREFSSAMNRAADEAGVKDIQKSLNSATNPVKSAMDGVKDATSSLNDLDAEAESETGKKAAERAEQARKIKATSARAAADRKAREAAEAQKKADEAEAALNDAAPADAPADASGDRT